MTFDFAGGRRLLLAGERAVLALAARRRWRPWCCCWCSTARSGGWSRGGRASACWGSGSWRRRSWSWPCSSRSPRRTWREAVRGRVLVAVDDSESMTTVDPGRPPSQLRALATSPGDRVEGLIAPRHRPAADRRPRRAAGPARGRPRRPGDRLRPRRPARGPAGRPGRGAPQAPPDRRPRPVDHRLGPGAGPGPEAPRRRPDRSAWSC